MDEVGAYLRDCRSAFTVGNESADASRYLAAVARDFNDPIPYYRLLEVAEAAGRMDLWRRGATLALRLPHDSPRSIARRAIVKQRLGDWSGWAEANAGVHLIIPEARRLLWISHEYDGTTDLREKALLIVGEGGFGDHLQSLCFVRPLRQRANRLLLTVPPELREFVQHNFNDIELIPIVPEIDILDDREFDAYVLMGSAPALFECVPSFECLQAPDPVSRSTFDSTALQIGVCWASSDWNQAPVPRRRSIDDLSLLEPLFALGGIDWHNLQVGPAAAQADIYPFFHQPTPPLTTFAATANLMAGLDAIVTVDTSVCHLAGRIGVPTFLLLRQVPDAYWGFDETTIWYPSMRLIRQHRRDDWSGAIETLATHLASLRPAEHSRAPLRLF